MYISAVFWRGFPLFYVSIIETFGWSRGATSAALSLQRLEGGTIAPFVGTAINKFGRRRVMLFGIICTGLSFMFMSQVTTLWQFYLSVVLLTVGMGFGTFIVLVSTVSNWFIKHRARALAILMTATAAGGLALPFLQQSIDNFGWREVLFGVGVGFMVIGLPMVAVMRNRPEDYGLHPDGSNPESATKTFRDAVTDGRRAVRDASATLSTVVRTRTFWQLAIASSLGQLVASSNLAHVDALKSFGITIELAATAIGFVVVGDLLGRFSIIIFGDRFNKKWLLSAAFVFEAIGIVALAFVNWGDLGLATLPIYIFSFGFGFGASVPLRLALLADYFGRNNYASIVGVTSAINALFQAGGAAFPGLMFDYTQDYRLSFLILGGLLILALPISATLPKPQRVAAEIRSIRIKRAGKGG